MIILRVLLCKNMKPKIKITPGKPPLIITPGVPPIQLHGTQYSENNLSSAPEKRHNPENIEFISDLEKRLKMHPTLNAKDVLGLIQEVVEYLDPTREREFPFQTYKDFLSCLKRSGKFPGPIIFPFGVDEIRKAKEYGYAIVDLSSHDLESMRDAEKWDKESHFIIADAYNLLGLTEPSLIHGVITKHNGLTPQLILGGPRYNPSHMPYATHFKADKNIFEGQDLQIDVSAESPSECLSNIRIKPIKYNGRLFKILSEIDISKKDLIEL